MNRCVQPRRLHRSASDPFAIRVSRQRESRAGRGSPRQGIRAGREGGRDDRKHAKAGATLALFRLAMRQKVLWPLGSDVGDSTQIAHFSFLSSCFLPLYQKAVAATRGGLNVSAVPLAWQAPHAQMHLGHQASDATMLPLLLLSLATECRE